LGATPILTCKFDSIGYPLRRRRGIGGLRGGRRRRCGVGGLRSHARGVGGGIPLPSLQSEWHNTPSIQTESYKRHMRTRKMVRKDVRDIFILFCIAKKGRRIDCCTALFRGAKSEKNVGKK
jgi:hypothetical protein